MTYSSGGVFNAADSFPTVGIVGGGRLGSTLAMAIAKLHRLEWVIVHSETSMENLSRKISSEIPLLTDFDFIPHPPKLIIITVPDGSIEHLANQIANHFGESLAGTLIVHCSGALGLEPLTECVMYGGSCAAIHPFQTFTGETDTILRGIAWGMECMPDDEPLLSSVIMGLGGMPMLLNEETRNNKSLYHAAAVASSNFLVTVIDYARTLALQAGIEPEVFLPQIIMTTVENCLNTLDGTQLPLTGPIARGDTDTVEKHIQTLAYDNNLQTIYKALSTATAITACTHGFITEEQAEELKSKLE